MYQTLGAKCDVGTGFCLGANVILTCFHTHTHRYSAASYVFIFHFLYIYFQLRGACAALQGAAGSRWTVLRVGRALHVSERAGGVLPLQQHRQGEDRVSAGPRAICQGEQSLHYRILVWFFF